MHPIITGDEILVPLNSGDRVTNAPGGAAAPFFPRAFPQPVRAAYVPQAAAIQAPQFVAPAAIQAPWQAVQPPVPQGAVVQIDLWAVIARLNWVDREDSIYPTLNPVRPSQKWSFAEWQAVQQRSRAFYDQLTGYLDREDFWHKNGIADQDQAKFTWHVIARGQQIYDAVKCDASFGGGYIGQDCGFIDFMRNWS